MLNKLPRQIELLTHPKYRSDIDGLRTIAVLSVVAYHAFPDWLRGGFVGVDIFFVISGFLISSIILNGVTQGRFSFRTFYARRIKRIFPALILVLVSCLVLGWFVLLPVEYKELGRHVVAGAGFVSNLVLWSESGYFDTAAELKPLLHLWSLGIEEQFYIVWPLVLYLAWRRRFNLLRLTLAVILASFLLNLYMVRSDQVDAFYSPLARFWELLVGSILAHLSLLRHEPPDSTLQNRIRTAKSVIGMSLIGFAVVFLNKGMQFPGWWALLPVVGAYLLISAGPRAFFNRTVLSSRPMVFIGLISYPLYLWHWPLLAFARIVHSGTPPPLIRLAAVVLSVVLAYLTYYFLEKPIRFSFSLKKSVPALSAIMLTTAVGSFAYVGSKGVPGRFSAEVQSYITYQYDFRIDARVGTCWLSATDAPGAYANDCVDQPRDGKPLVIVWGDSHAARFLPGLRTLKPGGLQWAQFTRDACPPMLDFGYENCVNANSFIVGKIKELHPDTVILFAVWNQYLSYDGDDLHFKKLALTIQKLNEIGIPRIIVVGPAPQWRNTLPGNLAREAIKTGSSSIPARTYLMFDSVTRNVDVMLRKQLETATNVLYFSALDAMCDETGCLTTVDGRVDGLTTWDYGHLTTPGASYLAQKLVEVTGDFNEVKP